MSQNPLKLLVLESEPVMAPLLADAGYELAFSDNVAEALIQIRIRPCDLIVLDLALRDGAGLAAFNQIQAAAASTPVLVVASAEEESAAGAALAQGALDYLLKTELNRQSLHSAIRKVLIRLAKQSPHPQESHLLQALMDNIPDSVYFKDINHRFLMINQTGAKKHNLASRDEIVGKSDADFWPKETAEKFMADELSVMCEAKPLEAIEECLKFADGHESWTSTTKMPLRNPFGQIVGTFAISRDITEQKKAAAALANERAILRLLVDNLPVCVFLKDCSARITLANPVYLRNFGLTRESDLIGKTDFDFFPREQAEIYFKDEQQVIESGKPLLNREEKVSVPDGPTLWMLTSKVPLHDAEGRITGLAGIALDITERKRVEELQDQLRQSQKLESIGQLAGGVAHEFNNILAVIQLLAGLIKSDEALPEVHRTSISEIEKATERAADLTRQLLQFSRKQTVQHRNLNLTDVATGICNLLQRALGGQIQMALKFPPRPLLIQADEGMMEQMIMNLAVNARDAMPNGGQLTIETAAVDFDALTVPQAPDARPGAFVCLSVTDTGSGIPPEVLPKIFDPFFTTKDVGKGSGLGLAAVFGIVRDHKGWIQVSTQLDKGTTFRIYFPRAAYLPVNDIFKLEANPVRTGSTTVLLVEDETAVRTALRDTLLKLGYGVIEAASGAEALAAWKRNPAGIQLLLTDLMMPGGMSGFQLATELLKENPKLKVVYASGYSAEIASENQPVILKKGFNFLPKPFDAAQLAQTLCSCLNASL